MTGRITTIQHNRRKAAKEREDESGGVVGRDRFLEISTENLSFSLRDKLAALLEEKIDPKLRAERLKPSVSNLPISTLIS
jgi:hypothetical protein